MKWIFPVFLFLIGMHMQAQNTATKLPKIGYIEGFWSNKYQIGEQASTANAVELHLQQNQNATGDAYRLWRKAKGQNSVALIYVGATLISGAAAIIGAAKGYDYSDAVVLVPSGLMLLSGTLGIVYGINSGENYRRSVQAYNKATGY